MIEYGHKLETLQESALISTILGYAFKIEFLERGKLSNITIFFYLEQCQKRIGF